jgi:hypothetical protein
VNSDQTAWSFPPYISLNDKSQQGVWKPVTHLERYLQREVYTYAVSTCSVLSGKQWITTASGSCGKYTNSKCLRRESNWLELIVVQIIQMTNQCFPPPPNTHLLWMWHLVDGLSLANKPTADLSNGKAQCNQSRKLLPCQVYLSFTRFCNWAGTITSKGRFITGQTEPSDTEEPSAP